MAEKRSEYYTIKEGKVLVQRKSCPRCGSGVFLGNHKDRLTCGKCGYTEFKK